MIPNDTNHDTLSIYFDFLEENNHNTEELRESLGTSNEYYYFQYIVRESSGRVGTHCIGDIVGGLNKSNEVCFSSGISSVGTSEPYQDSVGAKRFLPI